jgi:small-conductance mechanosensitive channel
MSDFFLKLREILDFKLVTIAGTEVTTITLVIFALILAVAYLLSKMMQRALGRAFRKRGVTEEGTVGVATRLVHYVLMLLAIVIGLQTIGFNLSALLAAGAVFAVAIGLAAKELMRNFISGIILLVERTIKPGDILELDDQMIQVRKLGFRTTVARTLDDEDVVIPNSKLVENCLKNFTLRDKVVRLRVEVGVIYGSDMSEVRRLLEEVARDFDQREKYKEPFVVLKNFGSSSVDWEVLFWVDDPWRSYPIRCAMREAIWHKLKEASIVIAFPQLDVHFDPPINEAVDRIGKAA